MTRVGFDRAKCGAMNMNDLAAAFEALVGEPPEKRNKLWMLKRMEQAAAARQAVDRAAARAARRPRDGGGARGTAVEPAPPESSVAQAPTASDPEPSPVTRADDAETPAEPREFVATPASPEAAAVLLSSDGGEAAAETVAAVGQAESAGAPEAAPSSAPPEDDGKPARRRYIPARFRAMTLAELHAVFAEKVGRPTKSADVPYLCWRITRAERLGDGPAAAPRRSRRTAADCTPRGEAKAVTLREYPDTLAAVEGVCGRRGFRNRLDFFRRAACHFLEALGEREAAAYFADPVAPDLHVSA
ncbi:MAG: hypothetical protein ACLQVI_03525 [Polyangiaceae bacterium]